MLHFIQNFVYYMTLEVIHPRVTQLERDVREVTDMDRLLEIHEKFLDSCLRECLLANPELLRVLTKIMTTALLFSDHIVQFMDTCHRACTPLTRITLNPGGPSTAGGSKEAATFTVSTLEKKRSQHSSLLTEKNADEGQQQQSMGSNNKVDSVALARHRHLIQQRREREQARADILHQEMNHEACRRVMNKFASTFDTQLKELLDGLWNNAYRQHAQLANLCVRLNYNGFYTSEFAT
jgi:gamma-tubulin complex component 2